MRKEFRECKAADPESISKILSKFGRSEDRITAYPFYMRGSK
jgi:hypothetical protein